MGRHIDTLQDFKTTIAGYYPELLLESEEWEAQFLAWLDQMAQMSRPNGASSSAKMRQPLTSYARR